MNTMLRVCKTFETVYHRARYRTAVSLCGIKPGRRGWRFWAPEDIGSEPPAGYVKCPTCWAGDETVNR